MENIFAFRYEIQDFIDAHRMVHNLKPILTSKMLKILAIVISFLLVVFIGIYLFSNLLIYISSGFNAGLTFNEFLAYIASFKNDLLCLFLFFAPTLLVFSTGPILRFRFWRMLRNNPDIVQDERKFGFNEQGISFSTSSRNSHFNWDYFERVIDGHKYFILLKTKDNYIIVPKRAFSEVADEVRFRELVSSQISHLQKQGNV